MPHSGDESLRGVAPTLTGRVGIVTGASRGIGAAITHELASLGATVFACARDKSRLEAIADQPRAGNGRIVPRAVDVSIEIEVEDLVGEIQREHDGLTFIVNNAGIYADQRLPDLSPETWSEIEAVNLRGVLWGCKHAVQAMLRGGRGGSVVNMGSVNSLTGVSEAVGYTMTKHAVLGLTRALASDTCYAKAGIRFNCVCPGDVETDMLREYWKQAEDPASARAEMESVYPTGRLGRPEEIAQLVAFLISPGASLLNGAAIVADGGLTARLY